MKEEFGNKTEAKCISFLTLGIRKNLEKLLQQKFRVKDIAQILKISRGTIWYERTRMGDTKIPYNAEFAHKHAEKSRICHIRNVLPMSYEINLVQIYKMLKQIISSKSLKDIRKDAEDCIFIIEKMGVKFDKIKKTLTTEEKIRIVELYNDGITINGISKVIKRSRSSIDSFIQKNKEKFNKTKEEYIYDELVKKYTDPKK